MYVFICVGVRSSVYLSLSEGDECPTDRNDRFRQGEAATAVESPAAISKEKAISPVFL